MLRHPQTSPRRACSRATEPNPSRAEIELPAEWKNALHRTEAAGWLACAERPAGADREHAPERAGGEGCAKVGEQARLGSRRTQGFFSDWLRRPVG